MKSKWVIWALVATALVAGAYLGLRPTSKAQGVVNVDSAKVQKLLTGAAAVHIVDVRTAGEFQNGHLKGAENVPVDQIASAATSWDRNQPLLVYCASGARSATAVQQLESMGFKTIYHFNGGLQTWQGALDSGASQPVAQAPVVKTNGRPVMYEFFTDW
jgi:thioredoxin 1